MAEKQDKKQIEKEYVKSPERDPGPRPPRKSDNSKEGGKEKEK